MKTGVYALILSLFLTVSAWSANVRIKITYEGKPVVGHTVTALMGGGTVGSGVTNSSGELLFSANGLANKSVDLKGEKNCEGGRKTWEVSGYVFLDGNSYAHLKMEEVIKEAVKASGGMFSANALVGAYGLVCSGAVSSSSSANNNSGSSEGTFGSSSSSSEGSLLDNDDEDDSIGPPLEEGSILSGKYGNANESDIGKASEMTYEERLAAQKTQLENKVYSTEKKIKRKQDKLEKKDLSEAEKMALDLEIKELNLEKDIDQNKLDRINKTIEQGQLSKREKDEFKATEKELKEELKQAKEARKDAKSDANKEKLAVLKGDGSTGSPQDGSTGLPQEDSTGSTQGGSTDSTEGNDNTKKTEDGKGLKNASNQIVDIGFDEENLPNLTEDELQEMKTKFTTESNNKSLKRKFKGRFMEDDERIFLEKEIEALEEALEKIEAEEERRKEEKKADRKKK